MKIDFGIGLATNNPNDFIQTINEIEELPILYTIDLVDFKNVSPDFYQQAKQQIEIIK